MTTRPGGKPKPGDKVVLITLPPGFLDDLPPEDQRAIAQVVGKAILFNEYDEYGRAELEFAEENGTIHYIYVSPDLIKAAQ